MATQEQLTQYLAEAEAAYHQLMVGKSVVLLVDQNGERIQYNNANKNALATYIESLKRQLGITKISGPMKAWF